MRKLLLVTIIALMAGSSALSATTYRLFIHGRSPKNHCVELNSTEDGKVDKNRAFADYDSKPDQVFSNVRFVGFNPQLDGGAFSTETCGAQRQVYNALKRFCTFENDCYIYTHSTGGLVLAYFLAQNYWITSRANIRKITLMANASGGSELANMAVWARMGVETLGRLARRHDIGPGMLASIIADKALGRNGKELDQTVNTTVARSAFNHNDTGGMILWMTSGDGTPNEAIVIGAITGGLLYTPLHLPGWDDGVVANHSLCGVNKVADVGAACPVGKDVKRIKDKHFCWKGYLPGRCTTYHERYEHHFTDFYGGGDHDHETATRHWQRDSTGMIGHRPGQTERPPTQTK